MYLHMSYDDDSFNVSSNTQNTTRSTSKVIYALVKQDMYKIGYPTVSTTCRQLLLLIKQGWQHQHGMREPGGIISGLSAHSMS